MKGRLIGFIGIVGLIFFLLAIFPSNLFAGEYSFIYKFKQPVVRDLGNGSQIVELENTRQNDAVIGAPLLPVKGTKIFIPAEEKVTSIIINPGVLKSIEGTYTIQHATRPYPISYQGPIKLDEPDPDIYSTDADYPSVIQVERGSQYLCGTQIVLVDLSPVVYNPVRGELKYYDKIEVTIQTEWQGRPEGIRPFRDLPADRKQILRTIDNKNDFLLLNPAPASQGQNSLSTEKPSGGAEIVRPAAAREYVVITTAAMISAFTNLTNHRQSSAGGSFTTHIEDIANIKTNYTGVDDAEKMRKFIIDMYNNPSYGTKYVVLGGDCDGAHGTQTISTRGCYAVVPTSPPTTDTYIPADLYFGCLDGTWNDDGDGLWGESNDGVGGGDIDWQSEVYVGRIPADSATEATEQINKIIAYETGSPPCKTLLVGEKLDSAPTWGGDRMDWVYGYMNSMPKTELYDRDHASHNWPKSDLLSHINTNDHNWLNHLGHGSPTLNMKLANADVASMTNTQSFFHYTQSCYSGSIDGRNSSGGYISGDCILEDMVNSNNHGAFAIIGNSRYGWYNPGSFVQGASNLAHKEFVEAIFTDGDKRLGEANQKSKSQLNLTQGVYRWIAFETNLLGCPITEMARGGVCDLINDGSFENGPPPASAWTEWTNTSCEWIQDPTGVWGIGAYDGTYAFWAGGYCGPPNSGYVEQSISVPAGATDFKFMTNFYRPDPDDASMDYFYVKINGTTVFTRELIQANNTYPSWAEQSINISAYAGQTVTLRFEATSAGDKTGNVLVDYVRICSETGPGFGDELAVDFGGNGLWHYSGSSWTNLAAWNPDGMVDWTGGMAVDFETHGLWNYDGSSWTHLAGWNPGYMEAYGTGLAIDFDSNGLWNYDGTTWTNLAAWDPATMEEWAGGLAVDFETHGLWNYDGSSWTHLASWNPGYMEAYGTGLAIDFGGNGLWNYDGSWTNLAAWNPEDDGSMEEWANGLAVDFGASYGLWNYNGSSWSHLAGWDSENIIDVNLH